MFKNKNHFEIGEKRFVWKEKAHKVENATFSVEEMKEQVKKTVDHKKDLANNEKEELKIKIDSEHKNEHNEKIYWSLAERDAFTKELMKEKSTEGIAKLIHAEIQNELFESKMDKNVEDYDDYDDNLIERDENETRDIIENAWASETKNLTKEQKNNLQDKILPLLNFADKNSEDEGDAGHKIFESVKDREGFAFGLGDKMLTKNEAIEIKNFIAAEANEMRNTPIKKEKSLQTNEEWEKQKGEAKNILNKGYNVNYNKNVEISEFIAKEVTENCKKELFQKYLTDFTKLGFTLNTGEIETTLQKILSASKNPSMDSKNFQLKIKSFHDCLTKMPEINTGRIVKEILEKNAVENNSQSLIEYIAFGNPQEDLKAAQDYFEADDALNDKEAVEKVDVKKTFEKNKVENNEDSIAGAIESASGAMKTFGECFEAVKEGKWGEAFSKFLEAFGQAFKAFIDSSAHLWNSLAVQIPDSALSLPLIGDFLTGIKKKAEKTNEDKKKLELAPITSALGIKSEEYPKAESLTITVEDFLEEKPDGMEKYAKKKGITLGVNELEALKIKLKKKENTITNEEKTVTVFTFLKNKIIKGEKADYLK